MIGFAGSGGGGGGVVPGGGGGGPPPGGGGGAAGGGARGGRAGGGGGAKRRAPPAKSDPVPRDQYPGPPGTLRRPSPPHRQCQQQERDHSDASPAGSIAEAAAARHLRAAGAGAALAGVEDRAGEGGVGD